MQSEAEIDGPHPRCRVLGQVREGLKRLLEGGHGLAERRAVDGPGAGLLAVGQGLLPDLTPQGMVRQAFDLLGHRSPASASRVSTRRACSARRRSRSRPL